MRRVEGKEKVEGWKSKGIKEKEMKAMVRKEEKGLKQKEERVKRERKEKRHFDMF